jgi:glycosyltransferase involved in cell wall biosynthesis
VTVAYTGNLYPWQDATPLWKMIRELHETRRLSPDDLQIDIVSRLPGAIMQSAAAAGVAQYVRYHGSVSREQALAMQRAADVLLLLDSRDPEADGVLHAKVFEYLATDRPILLLGSGTSSELHRMITAHGRLLSITELQAALEGHRTVPAGMAVDYATIAKRQLTDCLSLLEGHQHARAA